MSAVRVGCFRVTRKLIRHFFRQPTRHRVSKKLGEVFLCRLIRQIRCSEQKMSRIRSRLSELIGRGGPRCRCAASCQLECNWSNMC